MANTLSRRDFLALTAAGAAAAHRSMAARASMRLAAVGQSLILRDLATQDRRGFDQMRERLDRADVAFTNLEVAIRGPLARDAKPMGGGVNAEPVVLDSLRALSFDLDLARFGNCLAHFARMRDRPSVKKVEAHEREVLAAFARAA